MKTPLIKNYGIIIPEFEKEKADKKVKSWQMAIVRILMKPFKSYLTRKRDKAIDKFLADNPHPSLPAKLHTPKK